MPSPPLTLTTGQRVRFVRTKEGRVSQSGDAKVVQIHDGLEGAVWYGIELDDGTHTTARESELTLLS